MYGYVYKTTNLINNKIYVGQHEGEFTSTYKGSGRYFRNALNKYGSDNFSVKVLEYCDDANTLNEREIYWIAYYKDHGFIMYNISKGGDGGDTYSGLSDDDKEAIKNKLRDHGYFATLTAEQLHEKAKRSWVTRKRLGHINIDMVKLREGLKRYYKSPEYFAKQAERRLLKDQERKQFLDKWLSEGHTCEVCGKVLTSYIGEGRFCSKSCAATHPHTQETKDKLAEMNRLGICGNKGKTFTQEHKDKISASHKGRKFTEEHKKRLSEAKKGKSTWNKGLTKEDQRIAKYARQVGTYHHSDETKRKISEARKLFEARKKNMEV
jgi:group I intron endonuclease